MKKYSIVILLMSLLLIGFSTCKKDNEPPTGRFSINKEKEKVMPTTTSVTITGEYIFSGKVNSMKLQLGTNENLYGSDEYATELGDKVYSATISDLKPGTRYYYRYRVDYGDDVDYESDIYDFTTLSEAPTVKILAIEVLNNDSTSFGIICNVEANGGAELTECGICWNNYQNGDPTLDDEKQPYTGENNPYTIKMENLPARTFYHVKAYAKSSAGTGFSEKESFRTGGEATKPKVSTVEVSGVTFNSASCLCNVSSDGGLELIERGVCWSENDNPGLTDNHRAAEGEAIMGEFSITLTNLSLDKEYYVRAYAINAKGTTLADEVLPFKTTDGKPTVTTSGITDITATSAIGGGEVTDQGASPVTERGICWSLNHNPTTADSHDSNGSGMGSYTVDMNNLTPNQTYYVRAYATNSQGTAYGAEVDFMAMEGLPSVQTLDVTDVTTTSAKAHYKVTIEGGLEVSEHGICWSESNTTPTINDHYISGGNGTGTFSIDLNGLNPGIKYYVRAYAKNEQDGEAYGTAKAFDTEATLPTVTTDGIEGTTAHGTVTANGGKPVTERGICWSLNHNPTSADMHGSNGTGLGGYTVELTNLEPGKTYYYRAYATNEKGTAYGDELPLNVEANSPTVTTGEVSNIQQTTAQGSGNVTDDGGSPVNERGVCWSTSHNPTADGSHNTSGTGTGSFTVPMNGLTANTHYYVRAYAKNDAGKIGYGEEVDFTTSQNISDPIVTTDEVTIFTQTTAIGGGNVVSDGGADVTERGVCWSTNHNPTVSGSHIQSGSGTGSFTDVNMTGLIAGTTYYVRAYAINSHRGTSYGNEVYFTTQPPTTYTITVSANPTSGGSAHVGSSTGPTTGTFTQGQSCTVYAVANSGYYFANWTENGSVASTQANYTFVVTGNRTLVANFITKPTVTTNDVTNIQQTTATGGGNVTSDGGATVTARGVCWSTSSNPTISNSHTTDGTGTGSFTSNITGLTPGTLYHVRAYATNSAGTGYGEDKTFTTLSNGGSAPQGAINGQFTINSSGDKVYFAKGNLQYIGSATPPYWKFADNQWDYLGTATGQSSTSQNVDRDLFGWGTSGYHDPNDPYNVNYQPWSTSTATVNETYNYYGYGPSTNMPSPNLTGSSAEYDWGVHNSIYSGNILTTGWRTLTNEYSNNNNNSEWYYVLHGRTTSSGILYAKAQVNGVNGVILLPDDWSASYYSLSSTNTSGASYTSNTITASQWNTLEQHGAVFLPAAGDSSGTGIGNFGLWGFYWSASYYDSGTARYVLFYDGGIGTNGQENRYFRFAVRLVCPCQ